MIIKFTPPPPAPPGRMCCWDPARAALSYNPPLLKHNRLSCLPPFRRMLDPLITQPPNPAILPLPTPHTPARMHSIILQTPTPCCTVSCQPPTPPKNAHKYDPNTHSLSQTPEMQSPPRASQIPTHSPPPPPTHNTPHTHLPGCAQSLQTPTPCCTVGRRCVS
jgi:hypothetical protein